jgi:SAM-dependent methyltransferase
MKKETKVRKNKNQESSAIRFKVGKKKYEFLHPFRVDLACGIDKKPNFFGVDVYKDKGVDMVWNLERFPWPFPNNSIDEINCDHYIEHTKDLIAFMNERYRVLVPGGIAKIRAPYYNSMRAWQDPTHTREISEATFLYFNKNWRDLNKLSHYPIKADFDFTYGYDFMPEWSMRSEEAKAFAVKHYTNVIADISAILTKR